MLTPAFPPSGDAPADRSRTRRPQVRRSGVTTPAASPIGLLSALAPRRPSSVVVVGDLAVALEVLTAWPDASVVLLAAPGSLPDLQRLCADDPRLDVVETLVGDHGAPELPPSADVVVLVTAWAPLSVAGRRALAAGLGHAVVPGGCVVSCEPVDRRRGVAPAADLPPEVAGDRPGTALTPAEQDLLLRSAGFAACSAWEAAPGYRAVLGVHPDAGCQPVLEPTGRSGVSRGSAGSGA